MALTINFATPLSVTVQAQELGGQPTVLSISSVSGNSVTIDPASGKCIVSGTDNNGATRVDRFTLSAGTISALKADLAADLQAKYPSAGATVA